MTNLVKIQYIFLLMILITGGCRSRSRIVNLQSQWLGKDPTSIPYIIREKEFDKGNLASNPSFELGRYYNVDTVMLSFNLPGWKKVGEDVVWTDIQNTSEFEPDEASSGTHAIRIERHQADETDIQGEGIISDFIKVIPGNYRLSMDVRLSHIESNLARLGTGIYDAVNIRLYFYDRNKVMIKNEAYHPAYNNLINNSFKGQPFANFNYVSELKWSRLIARAGNFPFDEGNIPDDARYVRIFAGLKGTGTMWVDMVDFRYSAANFTFMEKVEPYFDSTLERSAYLLPRPQKTEFYKQLDLVTPDENKNELKPVILIPSTADLTLKKLVSAFVAGLKDKNLYRKRENPVVTRLNPNMVQSGRLIFSFGNTGLSNQFSDQLPVEDIATRKQAYYIQRLASLENVIFIGGSDQEGYYHAINTLNQLIDAGDLVYHHYDIIDYPDYTNRAMIIPVGDILDHHQLSSSDRNYLMNVGINEFIVEPVGDRVTAGTFYDLCRKQYEPLKTLKKDHDFLRIGLSFMDQKYPAINEVRNLGDDATLTKFEDAATLEGEKTAEIMTGLKDGTDIFIHSDLSLWNCLDLGAPAKSVKMLHEKPFMRYMSVRNAFWKGLGKYEIDIAGQSMYLYPLFPDNRIRNQLSSGEFCYNNSLEAFDDLYSAQLWTGPVAYSTIVDDIDLAQFSVNNPLPLRFFDNTLTRKREDILPGGFPDNYPGKARTGMLFEPYDVEFSPGIREGVNDECILNVNALSELTLVRLGTAADYLWNNSDYDPWLSTWKILLKRYGKDTAIELIQFNELYYHILSICNELQEQGYNQKLVKTGDDLVVRLDSHWDNLKEQLKENVTFLNDLSDLKNRIISRFFKVKKQPGDNGK